jgi:hypothetical protein
MARTYIKNESNELVPIGDTQGLVLATLEFLKGRFTGTTIQVNTNLRAFPIDTATVTGTLRYEQLSNSYCKFIADRAGIYSLSWGRCLSTSSTTRRQVSSLFNASGNILGEFVSKGWQSETWAEQTIGSNLFKMNAGDYLAAGTYDGSVTLNTTSGNAVNDFLFVRHEQLSPSIIANKGALISGGAFEFDIDGNCFPDIYSTNEVKCGKWLDGKPIYKKTYGVGTITLIAGTSWGSIGYTNTSIDRLINSEFIGLNDNSTRHFATVDTRITSSGDIQVTSTGANSVTSALLTVWYTKKMDV